jgi:hypothetical protein
MDFTLYSDVTGNLAAVDRLVVQYRMKACNVSSTPEYGKIGQFDESRSVIGRIFARLRPALFEKLCNILYTVMESTDKMLMMDADLETDCMVHDIVKTIWKRPSQRRVLRYTHTALPRQIAIVDGDAAYIMPM